MTFCTKLLRTAKAVANTVCAPRQNINTMQHLTHLTIHNKISTSQHFVTSTSRHPLAASRYTSDECVTTWSNTVVKRALLCTSLSQLPVERYKWLVSFTKHVIDFRSAFFYRSSEEQSRRNDPVACRLLESVYTRVIKKTAPADYCEISMTNMVRLYFETMIKHRVYLSTKQLLPWLVFQVWRHGDLEKVHCSFL